MRSAAGRLTRTSPRGRPGGQAGGDVDGGAVDVAVLEDHRAAVDADMGRRQAGSWRLGDHVEGGLDGVGGLAEDEHAGVAQPADRAAGEAAGDALDEGGQAAGELGGGRVAALLGQPGVAGEVD